jgi:hypothetical protein
MTTQPPLPEEAQSPYPIEEPSHDHAGESEAIAVAREIDAAAKRRAASRKQLGMGAAIGIGSAAIVAGLLYWRGNRK